MVVLLGLMACCRDDTPDMGDLTAIAYQPESMTIAVPEGFQEMPIPADNPMTLAGVELGRHLFFDPILSADSTMGCFSCHDPALSFTDGGAVSEGIDGVFGRRSAMSLLNVGFSTSGFLWDGAAESLEAQAILPVEDPVELHHTWPELEEKLQRHDRYPEMFRRAFGIENVSEIRQDLAVKAIAQFERTLVSSGNSKWDRFVRGEYEFTDEENLGYQLFFDFENGLPDAECGHCHNFPLFTINEDAFRNNGIEDISELTEFPDLGLGEVTGSPTDNGKFKIPTLRNVLLTAPYMHDGRFENIDQVLEHYNRGGHVQPNTDPLMEPQNLEPIHLDALKSFLETLTDEDFLNNPEFLSPLAKANGN